VAPHPVQDDVAESDVARQNQWADVARSRGTSDFNSN